MQRATGSHKAGRTDGGSMKRRPWSVRSNQLRLSNIGALFDHGKAALQARGHSRQIGDFRYLVVLSFGRSGSTVIQAALNSQPGVVIRGENMGVAAHLFRTYRSVVEQMAENEAKGIMLSKQDDPWFGAQLVDDRYVLEGLRHVLLNGILVPPTGAQIVGFKEVRHTPQEFSGYDEFRDYVVFLHRLMPEAEFLVNVRDIAATVKSGWWPHTEQALEVLSTAHQWLEQIVLDGPLLGVHAQLLDYSSWVADPSLLTEAFRNAGIEVDETALARALSIRLEHLH